MTTLLVGGLLAGMKIHSVLIVVEQIRDASVQQDRLWQAFSGEVASILKTAKGIEKLSENVFLMSLEYGMSKASRIFDLAMRHELKYRLLFFEKEPAWVMSES